MWGGLKVKCHKGRNDFDNLMPAAGLRYFSMAFLAYKGQIFFIKRLLFINVGHGLNFIIVLSVVFDLWRGSKIANNTVCPEACLMFETHRVVAHIHGVNWS